MLRLYVTWQISMFSDVYVLLSVIIYMTLSDLGLDCRKLNIFRVGNRWRWERKTQITTHTHARARTHIKRAAALCIRSRAQETVTRGWQFHERFCLKYYLVPVHRGYLFSNMDWKRVSTEEPFFYSPQTQHQGWIQVSGKQHGGPASPCVKVGQRSGDAWWL